MKRAFGRAGTKEDAPGMRNDAGKKAQEEGSAGYTATFFEAHGQDPLRKKRVAASPTKTTTFAFDPASRLPHNLRLAAYEQILRLLGAVEEARRVELEIYAAAPNAAGYRARLSQWKASRNDASPRAQADAQSERTALQRLLLTSDERRANNYPTEQLTGDDEDGTPSEILCDRCQLPVDSTASCRFHPGRRWRRGESRSPLEYQCCGGGRNSDPCCTRQRHVFSVAKLTPAQQRQRFAYWSLPPANYERAVPLSDSGRAVALSHSECTDETRKHQSHTAFKVYAMDCEMVYLEDGASCLVRVSVVDYLSGAPVVDALVQPTAPVFDWNTRYSGITPEMFVGGDWIEGATQQKARFFDEQLPAFLEFAQLQALFCKHFTQHDIFIGHSLENDLVALHLLHARVIDTAVLFAERASGRKYSLQQLTAQHAKRFIQDSAGGHCNGHDSVEDAAACISLVKHYLAHELPAREALKDIDDIASNVVK